MIVINFDCCLKLVIDTSVINTILKYKQVKRKNESGGILLGKKDINDDTYYITSVTTPSLFDKAGPIMFVRSNKHAQKTINRLWSESDGIVNYLGEWHTHNEKAPTPSLIDKALLKQIYIEKSNPFNYYFMLILGNDGKLFVGVVDSGLGCKLKYQKYVNIEEEMNA